MRNTIRSGSAGALELAAVMAISGESIAGALVNFEDFLAGDDVTGAGTAHPSLIITPVPNTDQVQAVETGNPLVNVMGAPNCASGTGLCKDTTDSTFRNNCLEDADGNRIDLNDTPNDTAFGFANITAQLANRAHEFDFTFVDNITV